MSGPPWGWWRRRGPAEATDAAKPVKHEGPTAGGQRVEASVGHGVYQVNGVTGDVTITSGWPPPSPHETKLPLGRPVTELTDPFSLEVHEAIHAGPGLAELPRLPEYVTRDHDRRLNKILSDAVSGHSAMAVLVGGSSTGKTRACWEAVQSLPQGWRLWHPIDPGRPEAAASALPRIGPHTVVWLNESQHYLLTPTSQLGEQVAAGLRELLRNPERGPVLVLGTVWPEHWNALTSHPAPGLPDPHAQARALLTGTDIPVPETFSGPALALLDKAVHRDPRLALAQQSAADGHITQFLAGAPALLERYRNAPPAALAVIQCAMDARRLGHSLPLSRSLLAAAVPAYLTDQQWDALPDDWLEQALIYTSAPCRGTRGPLSPIRPRPHQNEPDQLEPDQSRAGQRPAGQRPLTSSATASPTTWSSPAAPLAPPSPSRPDCGTPWPTTRSTPTCPIWRTKQNNAA